MGEKCFKGVKGQSLFYPENLPLKHISSLALAALITKLKASLRLQQVDATHPVAPASQGRLEPTAR